MVKPSTWAILASLLLLSPVFAHGEKRPEGTGIAYLPTPKDAIVMVPEGYRLVWHDEFDRDGAPSPAWTYEKGFVRNHELQWYQPDNATVSDGCLVIEGRHEVVPNPNYEADSQDWRKSRKEAQYTSSCLTTQQSFSFRYGRMEVRAKIPTQTGAWPAIWTLGNQWPWPLNGEIDIMEYYIKNGHPSILANACWGSSQRWQAIWDKRVIPFSHFSQKDSDWSNKFHTWRMDWDEHWIRLYLDDELLNEVDLTQTNNQGWLDNRENPFSNDVAGFGHYILLNLAIGGNGGTPDEMRMPYHYLVDYVRVFQPIPCNQSQSAHAVRFTVHPRTGAIDALTLEGDHHQMNWIMQCDGSQYPWISERHGWGLGYFTQVVGDMSLKKEWMHPLEIRDDGKTVFYKEGDVGIKVERCMNEGDLVEVYTWTNEGKERIWLHDVGVYAPFNDNYPNTQTCLTHRCHAHIWDGESGAYVNALRMGAEAPHLGLMLHEGAIKSYEVWGRGANTSSSHMRGLFAMKLPDMRLNPGQSYRLKWRLFSHEGATDFRDKLLSKGGVVVSSDKYVYESGETAQITLECHQPLQHCTARVNGVPVKIHQANSTWTVSHPMKQAGEVRVDFFYDNGKQTHADLLVINHISDLLDKRTQFIRQHQQMNNPHDPRDGAYMVYDGEADTIYLNDTPNCNPVDRDEGAERVGMGVLLAKHYLLQSKRDPVMKASLLRYAQFVRTRLQTPEYVTYSSVDQTNRNRAYNYPWVAEFYFQMYQATGNKQFVQDGYETMRAMFRQFGYGFYGIGYPVCLGLRCLKEAHMEREYRQMLHDFKQVGNQFIANGVNYPASEVNYEQSIVAPALQLLVQVYLETKEAKYLDEVKRQLPILEAFHGFQPSFHLHEIAIRHWDGYWFGKYELFGDTFPHYWSTVTASVYHYYALCSGDTSYQKRAEEIVRNNLCLFFEDGKASCAYLYPEKVNGEKADFYDPYANNQDWALVYWLQVMEKL